MSLILETNLQKTINLDTTRTSIANDIKAAFTPHIAKIQNLTIQI